MHQKFFFKLLAVLATSVAAILVFATLKSSRVTVAAAQGSGTQGALQILDATEILLVLFRVDSWIVF